MHDGIVASVALAVGLVGGALWSRWRHQVVKELRAIHHLLLHEQVPVLRHIRDHLDAASAEPRPEAD